MSIALLYHRRVDATWVHIGHKDEDALCGSACKSRSIEMHEVTCPHCNLIVDEIAKSVNAPLKDKTNEEVFNVVRKVKERLAK